MRASLDDALQRATAPLVVAAAGHDHNLQVFDDPSGVYYLVSGSGSQTRPAGRTSATMFKHGAHGYARLDFLNDGRVFLAIVEPTTPGDTLAVLKLYSWGLGGTLEEIVVMRELIQRFGGFGARRFFPAGVGIDAVRPPPASSVALATPDPLRRAMGLRGRRERRKTLATTG